MNNKKSWLIITLVILLVVTGSVLSLAQDRKITIATWGGLMAKTQEEAFFAPFTAKTGIQIEVAEITGDVVAKVKAQVMQNTPDFDLVCGTGVIDQVPLMAASDALYEIDYSKIANAQDIPNEVKAKYGMGAYILSNNIAYNKKFYPNGGPQNMKDFFDTEKFPGPRAIIGFAPTGYLESALIADGVPVDQLYPLDVDRAFAKLDQLKPSIALYWETGAQQTQALIDEEVYCGMFWPGRALASRDAGVDLEYVWQDGHMIMDCWVIPKTCRDLDAVYQFLNFVLKPEQEVIFTRKMKYGSINPKTVSLLTPEEQVNTVTYAENMKKMYWVDYDYWSQNFESLSERFLNWITQK